MSNDRKFVGEKADELRELATVAVGDPLATRFDMFVQLVRDVGIDSTYAASFAEGFRLALEEADKKLAPQTPSVFRVRWESQLEGGGSDTWHKYELVMPEADARFMVSKSYPVPIRRNVRLEARVGSNWILIQEGETEESDGK